MILFKTLLLAFGVIALFFSSLYYLIQNNKKSVKVLGALLLSISLVSGVIVAEPAKEAFVSQVEKIEKWQKEKEEEREDFKRLYELTKAENPENTK